MAILQRCPILHDGYNLNRLYIEIVFRQPRAVNRCCRPVGRPGHLTAKCMSGISCRGPLWRGVGVRIAIACTPIWQLELSLRTSLLTPAIISMLLEVVKHIFFPSDLNPCSGENILHGGVVELCQLFLERPIREESLPEGVDGCLLVAERDCHLLSVEPANIVAEWLAMTLLDVV